MSTLRSTSCDLTAFVHKLDRLRTISHALLSLFGYSALIRPFDTKGILENIKTSKEYGNARADLSMTNSELPESVNVLFVDDDVTLLRLGADLMEESGFAVIIACCPLEAISIMADTDEIDIAILDYHMPIMNGCVLADRLRSMHPELKTILYSGAIDIPPSEMTNVDAFISKGDCIRRLLLQVFEFARTANRGDVSAV